MLCNTWAVTAPAKFCALALKISPISFFHDYLIKFKPRLLNRDLNPGQTAPPFPKYLSHYVTPMLFPASERVYFVFCEIHLVSTEEAEGDFAPNSLPTFLQPRHRPGD